MIFARGGQRVSTAGSFWNLADGTRVDIPDGGGRMPGTRKTAYIRRPAGGAVTATIVCIVLYVVTLPLTSTLGYLFAWFFPAALVLIGLAVIAWNIAFGIYDSATMDWSPFMAYLRGKRDKRDKKNANDNKDEKGE